MNMMKKLILAAALVLCVAAVTTVLFQKLRQPVVLGSLHSGKNTPPASLTDNTADDALSGFFTRSGLSLVLDDKKKSLLIKTPAGHQVLLDDDAKSLGLKDSHGNEITLDKDGVVLNTAQRT